MAAGIPSYRVDPEDPVDGPLPAGVTGCDLRKEILFAGIVWIAVDECCCKEFDDDESWISWPNAGVLMRVQDTSLRHCSWSLS